MPHVIKNSPTVSFWRGESNLITDSFWQEMPHETKTTSTLSFWEAISNSTDNGNAKWTPISQMKTPERSRTSRVSQIVQTFCPKAPFLLRTERRTGQMVWPWECSQTDRQTHGSDSMTSTADAGGNKTFQKTCNLIWKLSAGNFIMSLNNRHLAGHVYAILSQFIEEAFLS